jgi:hypothetical protein
VLFGGEENIGEPSQAEVAKSNEEQRDTGGRTDRETDK